jgi:hypothetical protein
MPTMATYCNQKSSLVNYKKLIANRKLCIESIRGSHQSITIGVRPTSSEVDSATHEILQTLQGSGHCIYVNPCNEDCDRLLENYGNFTCERMTLEDFLR